MARKRFTKPGFFSNEDLADLSAEVRLFFIGSWCWADREGRLEDRPKRLKANIMPYDNIDINLALNQLQEKGFIIRYTTTVNGAEFKAIQILKFTDHQDVHVKEQASTIPAPVLPGASPVQPPVNNGASTSLNLEPDTSTLNFKLLPVEDEVEERLRENEIEGAITDFLTAKEVEKEKNSAQKEKEAADIDLNSNASFDPQQAHLSSGKPNEPAKKPLPTTDEMEVNIVASNTCHWWNVIQFYLVPEAPLPKGFTWDQLPDEQKQVYFDRRHELFKKFYATKQDAYKIRLPSCNDIAQNFYNWVPSEQHRESLHKPNNNAKSTTKSGDTKSKATNDRIGRNNGIEDLVNQSAEFLRQYHG